MKYNYVLTDINELIEVLQKMKETYPERIFVTGVTSGGKIKAPSKKTNYYTHELKHVFSEECFTEGVKGVSALMDGGGFYVAHLPKKYINPALIKTKTETDEDNPIMSCPCGCGMDPCIES